MANYRQVLPKAGCPSKTPREFLKYRFPGPTQVDNGEDKMLGSGTALQKA